MVAPNILTIAGLYTNNSTFTDNTGKVFFDTGASIAGGSVLTGSSPLNNVELLTSISFPSNASTTDLTITSGTLTAPSGYLSISGNYTNNSSFTYSSSTVNFNGSSAQTIAGTMNTSATDFANLIFSGGGTKTFSNNASTTDFTINSGATVVAPTILTIAGLYTNNGTFPHNSGKVIFDTDASIA